MSMSNLETYRQLTQDMNKILEEMDTLWYTLTDEERQQLDDE